MDSTEMFAAASSERLRVATPAPYSPDWDAAMA
jgi:hypothetical protein